MAARPEPVGRYAVLQDFEDHDLSIRIIEMAGEPEAIAHHVHRRSTQVYVVLEGAVTIYKGDSVLELGQYEVATVPKGVPHGARPEGGRAVIMNISTPPVAADDQVAETS